MARIQQPVAVVLSHIDVILIKGIIVRGSAGLVGVIGICSRSLHVGNINSYVYWFLTGLIVLWAVAIGIIG